MAKIKIVRLIPLFHSHDPAFRRGVDDKGNQWGEFAKEHLMFIVNRVDFKCDCQGGVDESCDLCVRKLLPYTPNGSRTFWMSRIGTFACCDCVVIDEQENAADLSTSGAP